ncbi:substrate-binding domain-containing protein, partial [Mycobacterium tuberculosis]|nr:substrate-binding domain-containing protein [Mycobacterium tuberculosis]
MKLVKTAIAGVAALAFAGAAFAVDITGAGATFPAPVYNYFAADYNKATNTKVNYQCIGSSGGIKQITA